MADLTGIGTSALLAFQRSLSTVGHNISNATTEGFSRQRVSFATLLFKEGQYGQIVRIGRLAKVRICQENCSHGRHYRTGLWICQHH